MLSSCLGATGHFRFNLTKMKEHRRHLSSALPERLEQLEELDEFSTAMTVPDQGMNLAGQKINARQQAQRSMSDIFVIAAKGLVRVRLWRQIRRRRPDRLHPRLFIIGDDRDAPVA